LGGKGKRSGDNWEPVLSIGEKRWNRPRFRVYRLAVRRRGEGKNEVGVYPDLM